jgi:hypothetical protein
VSSATNIPSNIKSGESKTFSIGLVPLRTGLLSLPTVVVKCVGVEECRTICRSAGKQVRVQPRSKSSTVFATDSLRHLVSEEAEVDRQSQTALQLIG